MIEIMEELHRYIPCKTETKLYENQTEGLTVSYKVDHLQKVLFGGDQLTCARARSSQRYRMNSACTTDALLGLVPCCEDWHAKVTFLMVSFNLKRTMLCLHACTLHS